MWIANHGNSNWIVGERSLPAKTYLEIVPDDAWDKFFADPTVASRVATGELAYDASPPPEDLLWYDVRYLNGEVPAVGICLACHAPIDVHTGRFTGEGTGGGNSWTLYLQDSSVPADVRYEDVDTLVIERRT